MAEKKDRSRFSIKFNENDPAHNMVIGLLEQQSPRNKASFIANAILHYVHCPETPDITQVPVVHQATAIDRASIEAVVKEILQQQGITKQEPQQEVLQKAPMKAGAFPLKDELVHEGGKLPQTPMDDTLRAIIANTMSAFRSE